jgi:peptidase E
MRPIQIVAMGGGGFTMEPDNPLLDDYLLGLTGKAAPRVCFLPTASGDSAAYIESFYQAFAGRAEPSHLSLFGRTVDDLVAFLSGHDVVYVGGGNTANLLAVWRVHRLDAALRAAGEAGTILAGLSAGALCWFGSGVTDSFGPRLAPLDGGLGFVSGSMCPHYDSDPTRRPTYQRLVAEGRLPDGVAADDGVALHFLGGALSAAVSSRPAAGAYRIERAGTSARETALPVRYLGDP